MQLQVTDIAKIIEASSGELVELPPFANGTQFVARLRRPSLMKLAASGKIPNSLLGRANSLFVNQATTDYDNEDMLTELANVLEIFAEASFIEPTWQQLKEANVQLTDQQYFKVFEYAQVGIQQLTPNNGQTEDIGHSGNSETI